MPRCSTLCVSNFPSKLNDRDREDLLKHFGARSVRCMPAGCRYQGVVFAAFGDADEAESALKRLHQLDVLGRLLRAEYAKKCHAAYTPLSLPEQPELVVRAEATGPSRPRDEPADDSDEPDGGGGLAELTHVSEAWSISYPANPTLLYKYPAPTVTILTNMAHALASVPRFYVQTLHLMNKLNLPPPFGALGPAPRLLDDRSLYADEMEERAMEISESSSESELEDDGDGAAASARAAGTDGTQRPKRPLWVAHRRSSGASSSGAVSKRSTMRVHKGAAAAAAAAALARSMRAAACPLRPVDLASVFDSAISNEQQHQQRKIAIKVSGQWTASDASKPSEPDVYKVTDASSTTIAAVATPALAVDARDQSDALPVGTATDRQPMTHVVAVGAPAVPLPSAPVDACAGAVTTHTTAATLASVEPSLPAPPADLLSLLESGLIQLQQRLPADSTVTSVTKASATAATTTATDGQTVLSELPCSAFGPHRRLTPSEMSELPVFKNYARGDPCSRIYIKNLSKHVTDEELRSLFVAVLSAAAAATSGSASGVVADVRLMTEGRMKGQAFVTFDAAAAAEQALELTNGLVLHDKPMVVMFAKSAK